MPFPTRRNDEGAKTGHRHSREDQSRLSLSNSHGHKVLVMLRSAQACFAIVWFCGFAAANSHIPRAADYDGVYEGTIGAARVVVELGDTRGTYFYATKGIDIFLQVSAKNGAIEVVEKSGEDDESVAP